VPAARQLRSTRIVRCACQGKRPSPGAAALWPKASSSIRALFWSSTPSPLI